MYVEKIKSKQNGRVYTTVLVRETYRQKGKVRHRTISNITKFSPAHIRQVTRMLSGRQDDLKREELELSESREYGASFGFLELMRKLGLDRIIYSRPTPWRNSLMAMIVGRIIYQGSKLSLTNMYRDTCLWELCGHEAGQRPDVEKACYGPLDQLLRRQSHIQRRLAQRHLTDGCLVLYDITNTWFEGEYEDSVLVDYGREKSGKHGYKQVAIGLITDKHGCPVAVEVFNGRTSDQTTVKEQVERLSVQYGVKEIIFAGDRGMLTPRRIEEVNAAGYRTLTALTHPQIMALLERRVVNAELFDKKELAEVFDPENPTIRYVLCSNPATAIRERTTRASLMAATSQELDQIARVKRKRDPNAVSARVGRLFGKYKVGKFYEWSVDKKGRLQWSVKDELVEREQAIDGCYVIRSDVDPAIMDTRESAQGYKSLQHVEKAFRNLKTVLLEIRPVFHKTDDRIRAHVFLCMLAYYIQWHATERLKPLFEKDGTGRERRWSMEVVIERLKSITKMKCFAEKVYLFDKVTKPDKEQSEILDLIGVELR